MFVPTSITADSLDGGLSDDGFLNSQITDPGENDVNERRIGIGVVLSSQPRRGYPRTTSTEQWA
jgi:hypothetical protein